MNPQKWSNIAVKRFNDQLRDLFGVDTVTGQPMWRIVWSDDEFEKRLTQYSDGGILLLRPEVRLLPKYKQYIQARYIMEHLVGIPEVNEEELPTMRMSYEPVFTFMDKDLNYLPPNLLVAKCIISTVESAMELARTGRNKSKSFRKFVDEEFSQEASIELKNRRIMEMEEYLWGDQAAFHGSMQRGETIIVP